MSQCKNCGIELSHEVKFCTRCGALNEEAFAPAVGFIAPLQTPEYNAEQNYQDIGTPDAPPPVAPQPQRTFIPAPAPAPTPAAPKKEYINTSGMLAWSIITLLCCNVGGILGLLSIVFSVIAGVEKDYEPAKAKKYIYSAKVLNIIALIIGVIVAILYATIIQAAIAAE